MLILFKNSIRTKEKSNKFVIVKFKGIDNINDVEQYKGSSLFCFNKENAVSLEENEYYIADLIGMEVLQRKVISEL